jgi:hypothetical protein
VAPSKLNDDDLKTSDLKTHTNSMNATDPIQHIAPESILAIAREIRQSPLSSDEKKQTFAKQYELFQHNYPTLFTLCCETTIPLTQLEYMIERLKRVQEDHESQHDASVLVGKRLADEYISPLIHKMERRQ